MIKAFDLSGSLLSYSRDVFYDTERVHLLRRLPRRGNS